MKISDMISMCLGNLFRRKMRTLLTISAWWWAPAQSW